MSCHVYVCYLPVSFLFTTKTESAPLKCKNASFLVNISLSLHSLEDTKIIAVTSILSLSCSKRSSRGCAMLSVKPRDQITPKSPVVWSGTEMYSIERLQQHTRPVKQLPVFDGLIACPSVCKCHYSSTACVITVG